jgi:hypothetical protein
MKTTAEKPLFIPLTERFYRQFERGLKSVEFRPEGRGWNRKTCRIGRAVVLSLGYGKKERMTGKIVSYTVQPDASQVPGWVECYGKKPGPVACIGINLTR